MNKQFLSFSQITIGDLYQIHFCGDTNIVITYYSLNDLKKSKLNIKNNYLFDGSIVMPLKKQTIFINHKKENVLKLAHKDKVIYMLIYESDNFLKIE